MEPRMPFSVVDLTRSTMLAVAVVALLVAAAPVAADECVLHVAPDGRDTWTGRHARPTADGADGPLASLVAARDAIRAARGATDWQPRGVRVVVASGTYRITAPLVLEPRDSGTAEAPIVYEAAPGGPVVISGGRRIEGWRVADDGSWVVHLPDAAADGWRFEQLFVGGRRAVRARSPNRFWSHAVQAWEEKNADGATTRWLRVDAADAAPLAALSADELGEVLLTVYHKWDVTQRRVERLDAEGDAIVTTGQPMKPWNPWSRESTFILENARAFLDAPGEWFLARDGTLTYKPLPGESPETTEVVAPVAEHWIRIAGDPAADAFVEHVTFRGLTFHHGQWNTPAGGCEPMQAAAWVDAMVTLDGARHVTLEGCELAHFGRAGVWFRRGSSDCALRRCRIFDAGAGGVKIGETGKAPSPAEATAGITVEDCILHRGGRILPCAVGVWIGWSPGNRIVHNDIGDFLYTGVSAGWRWGYAESTCKGNTIAHNHIHHIGYGPLADMGGVYTLGPSEGTVVSDNVIHHVWSRSYGGWGLYPDEGSTGITFERNLVHDTKDGSFHQHYGRDNVVRNNVFVDSAERQVALTRPEPHRSFTFEHNVVAWKTGAAITGPWGKAITTSGSNCWWHGGRPVEFLGAPLAKWQELGHETGSIVADPGFVDAGHGDYRLRADSPALAIGIASGDWSKAGVRGDEAWRAQARAFEPPSMEMPAPAAGPIDLTFERDPVGRPPSSVDVEPGTPPARLVVTDTTAATGRRSLEFTDAPGVEPAWAPHLWVNAAIDRGTVTNSFALRAGPGTNLAYEWRDWRRDPYATGVWLAVRGGRLWIVRDGKEVAVTDIPEGVWVRFVITARMGPEKPRDWSLVVEVPAREAARFDGLTWRSAGFERLTWTGFSSVASRPATFHLDDYRLEVGKRP
jgi:hypothetical protein